MKRTLNNSLVYLPVCLNVKGKDCLIVGGGNVAFRKVKTLLRFSASVTCVSPETNSGLSKLIRGKKIKYIKGRFSKKIPLRKYMLVIAATDDEHVNSEIVEKGEKWKVLVNSVTGRDTGSINMPAIIKKRNVCVAVSTQGRDPALSRAIKEKIRKIL